MYVFRELLEAFGKFYTLDNLQAYWRDAMKPASQQIAAPTEDEYEDAE